jgi:hypothetical protein
MPPRGDRDAEEKDDLLSHLKPNAPVSVVKAAKYVAIFVASF